MGRKRRTSKEVTQSFEKAAEQIIQEQGVCGITLRNLCERAEADFPMFYNRYASLTTFIEDYIRQNDFWLGHLQNHEYDSVTGTKEELGKILSDLWNSLNSNAMMRSILRMELQDTLPEIAKETAAKRDSIASELVRVFVQTSKHSEIHTRIMLAIVTAGISYLALHKDISEFCGVDFSDEENANFIIGVIKKIASAISAL